MATKRGALALLLAGVIVGVAGAQVVGNLYRIRYITTGVFRLTAGETLNFHVTLDAGPASTVHLRLLNYKGILVADKLVSLATGQSATLAYAIPGLYRAQAEVLDSTLTLSEERVVTGTLEVLAVEAGGTSVVRILMPGPGIGPGPHVPDPEINPGAGVQ